MAWLGTWQNRIKLTVPTTKVAADLTNFPFQVYIGSSSGLTATDLTSVFDELTSDANRTKIAVTTSDGITECKVEIVKWDDANEQAWLNVKAPALSSSANTDFYLYFDADQSANSTNVGDIGSAPAKAVWANGFVSVHHMTESGNGTASEFVDATGNAHHGTGGTGSWKSPARIAGPTGYCQNYQEDASLISIPDHDDYSVITNGVLVMSFWFNLNTLVNLTGGGIEEPIHFLSKGQYDYDWGWVEYSREAGFDRSQRTSFYIFNLDGGQGAGYYFSPTDTINVGDWVFATGKLVVTTGDNGLLSTYKNGVLKNSRNWQDGQYTIHPENGTSPVWLGTRDGVTPEYLNAKFAEFRVSKVDRSDSWVGADYFSQGDALINYGTFEVLSGGGADYTGNVRFPRSILGAL